MKILSHDLQMASTYSFSQELVGTRTSFESLIVPANFERIPQNDLLKPQESETQSFDYFQTLSGIIDRLIDSLRQRMGTEIDDLKSQTSKPMFSRTLSIQESYMENESFSFSTQGKIMTDSQEIDIDIDFSMTRSFVVEHKMDIYQSFDPLIININGEIPELSQTRFSFDLDNDGEEDQISKLNSGSGFLALDKNEDGEINQGSELFGTILGDGFSELSEYDLDNNSWIDENDSIFEKLRIWFTDEDDNKELVGLGEAGVGAIFLQATDAQYSYKTQKNETLGELKSSGIFLHESGIAGTISQIDFDLNKVEKEPKEKEYLGKLLQS